MTKRFFIWIFWYFVGFLVLRAGYDLDPGGRGLQLYAGGGLAILFGWWSFFLANKYPSKRKMILSIGGAIVVLLLITPFASS